MESTQPQYSLAFKIPPTGKALSTCIYTEDTPNHRCILQSIKNHAESKRRQLTFITNQEAREGLPADIVVANIIHFHKHRISTDAGSVKFVPYHLLSFFFNYDIDEDSIEGRAVKSAMATRPGGSSSTTHITGFYFVGSLISNTFVRLIKFAKAVHVERCDILQTCCNLLCKRSLPCINDVNDTMTCSRCRGVYYCDTTCQKVNWPTHKLVCKATVKTWNFTIYYL